MYLRTTYSRKELTTIHSMISMTYEDKEWYAEAADSFDCNPNSNGTMTHEHQAEMVQKELKQKSFIITPSATSTGKGNVYTRNKKKFDNCVNACSTPDHERLLCQTLEQCHLELMALSNQSGRKKKRPVASSKDEQCKSPPEQRGLVSAPAVEKQSVYTRQKPLFSPSRFKGR